MFEWGKKTIFKFVLFEEKNLIKQLCALNHCCCWSYNVPQTNFYGVVYHSFSFFLCIPLCILYLYVFKQLANLSGKFQQPGNWKLACRHPCLANWSACFAEPQQFLAVEKSHPRAWCKWVVRNRWYLEKICIISSLSVCIEKIYLFRIQICRAGRKKTLMKRRHSRKNALKSIERNHKFIWFVRRMKRVFFCRTAARGFFLFVYVTIKKTKMYLNRTQQVFVWRGFLDISNGSGKKKLWQ